MRSKKPESGMPGLKVLITAASLAATLGGWAALALESPHPATTVSTAALPSMTPVPSLPSATAMRLNQPTVTTLALNRPPATALVINLPPLPTLVPPPASPTTPARQPVLGDAVAANVPAPVVQAQPQQPQPQPTLRVVDAPPPPPPPPAHAQAQNPGPGPAPAPAPQPAPVTVTKTSGR